MVIHFFSDHIAFNRFFCGGDGFNRDGNIPAAIFNASISSLLGVFITPLWMGLVLDTASGHFDLME